MTAKLEEAVNNGANLTQQVGKLTVSCGHLRESKDELQRQIEVMRSRTLNVIERQYTVTSLVKHEAVLHTR